MPGINYRLAIDLSGSLLKVVEGAVGGPIRCGSGGVPSGAMAGGKVVDPGGVGMALRQLLARTEVTETRAFVAASDAIATFRVLTLPAGQTDQQVAAAVAKELPLDPERLDTQWLELHSANEHRLVYAAAWDRSLVRGITDAVRAAGVEPEVVDLKSACIARAVVEPSCVVVDVSSDPAEIVLIDNHVPQVWHSVTAAAMQEEDLGAAVSPALRSIFRFYKRRRDSGFGPGSPIFIASEQRPPEDALASLRAEFDHPVQLLPAPPRIPDHVRHATYLTCLGLIMRRSA